MKLIFCIESDWEGSARRQSTILPMLQCINGIYPTKVKYIYRTANTVEEFIYCLKKFKQVNKTYDDFCCIFICGHGKPGIIQLGGGSISLEELANISKGIDENLFSGHILHFDSCSVIKGVKNAINKFMKATKVSYITGFGCDVDFIESIALEMILIDYLSDYNNAGEAIKEFSDSHSALCKHLKFKAISNISTNNNGE